MSDKEYKWLPHIENSVNKSVFGYSIGMYSITLEAWRRGLNVKFINSNRNKPTTLYEISDGKKSHRFISSRGDLITKEAVAICKNKAKAKEYLEKAKVPIPNGKEFTSHSKNEEIIEYANKIGYPLVIKPVDGSMGKGVIANIKNQNELQKSLDYVRKELGYRHIIVEEFFPGEDYRVYVVGNEVVGIIKRIPANVIGDGISTIRQLIDKKNDERKKNPILNSSLIIIDKELKDKLQEQNLTLDSIPPEDNVIFLKTKNNISAGGDPVDITDQVSEAIKTIAIRAINAIPGLPHGGVDLMVNKKRDKAVVLELNSQASLRTHLFPMKGIGRDIPKKIIDYYFPSTENNSNVPLYYDFGPIWNDFRNGTVKEWTLPSIPNGNLILTRFVVTGRVQRVGYGFWIRKKARELKLHGFVRHLRNGQASIVVCGDEQNVDQFRQIINNKSSRRAEVIRVEEKVRNTPVPIGFVIKNPKRDRIVKDGYYPQRVKDPKRKNKTKKVTKKNFQRKKTKQKPLVVDYEKEYKKVINSTSWKVTKPLRLLGRLLKRIK